MIYLLIIHCILAVYITIRFYKEQLTKASFREQFFGTIVFLIMSLLFISYLIIGYYWGKYYYKLLKLWIV
jgi:hypothetical protein